MFELVMFFLLVLIWENRSRCTIQGLAYEFSFTHPNQHFIEWVGLNIQNIKWDWEWFDTSYYQLFSRIEIPTSQSAFERIEILSLLKNKKRTFPKTHNLQDFLKNVLKHRGNCKTYSPFFFTSIAPIIKQLP